LNPLAGTQAAPTYKSEFTKIEPVTLHTVSQQELDRSGAYQRPTLLNLRTSYDFGPAELWLHVINLTDERAAQRSLAAIALSRSR